VRTDLSLPNRQPADDRHLPLSPRSRLVFDAAACLPTRFPEYDCGLCEPACPVEAIMLGGGAPMLTGECVGCGRCAAVCPTAALQIDGFALPAAVGPSSEVYVDCWRVPLGDSPRGALRVPCLAGINAGWLLALFDLSGERPIRLLDRGGCARCTAGSDMSPLTAALNEASALLAACGVLPAALPRRAEQSCPSPLAPAIPDAAGAVALDRRGFFRGLIGGAARTADSVQRAAAPAAAIRLHHLAQPVERMRIVTSLARIAGRRGKQLPALAVPQLSHAGCDAAGVCAAVCPTGALQRREDADGTAAELRFDATLCVACGQCARVCPQQALGVAASGGRHAVEVLARWTANECANCGEPFYGALGAVCPNCTKRTNLQQGLAALFQPSA
jgi:ferredoxin